MTKPESIYDVRYLNGALGFPPLTPELLKLSYDPMHHAMTIKHRVYIEIERQIAKGATWHTIRAAAQHLPETDAVRIMLNRPIGQTDAKNIRSLIRAILQEAGILPDYDGPQLKQRGGEQSLMSLSGSNDRDLRDPDDIAIEAAVAKRVLAIAVHQGALEFLENLPLEPQITPGEYCNLVVEYTAIDPLTPLEASIQITGHIYDISGYQRWAISYPNLGANVMLSYGSTSSSTSWRAVMRQIMRDGYRIKLWMNTELTEFYDQGNLNNE